MRTRTVKCPCGAEAFRLDTRRALPETPRILRVRLYQCTSMHQFETAETIVGPVREGSRTKTLIYRYTEKRNEKQRHHDNGYAL